jgi:hypothetical protein
MSIEYVDMSMTFTKLFSSITESTVWYEPDSTRLVWITMLAMADRQGRIHASVPGLAGRARVALEATREALACLMAPDPDSRTKDFEGRRVEEIDGGWRLLNHAKYREMRDEADRQVYQREWVKGKRRQKDRQSTVVDKRRPPSTNAEAEAEAESEEEIPRARAPKGGRGISSEKAEELKRRREIRDKLIGMKNTSTARDFGLIAQLTGSTYEEVKREWELWDAESGSLAARVLANKGVS